MNYEERKRIREIMEKSPANKRKDIALVSEIVTEIMLRCPYLSKTPQEEWEELVVILREKGF